MQQLRTPRAQLHDMWSKEPKQARIREPRVLQLRKQQNQHHHQRAEVNLETTKAVAWAVFQHHGGGDGAHNRGHNSHGLQQQHNMAARRPSRFKIEAQMKHELAHHTYTPPLVGAPRWDAGSTLFDSFELESLLRTLDQATHPHHHDDDDEDDLYDDDADAGAVVLYSPNAQPQSRLGDEYEDEEEDDDDEEFSFDTPAKSKRVAVVPVKEELKAHHHNMWKSFLHSLHLDGFHKLQSQVAPHDVAQSKKKHSKRARGRGVMDAQQQQEHRHQLWKLSVKAAIKGQEQDLQSALAVASEAVSHQQQQQKQHHHHHHHYQHHHHHVHDEREDDEMTIQAITKRAARTSLDETRRRVSIEFERGNGLEAPRNSLDIDDRERAGVPKSLSLWDVFEL